jgi:hypothetical protein
MASIDEAQMHVSRNIAARGINGVKERLGALLGKAGADDRTLAEQEPQRKVQIEGESRRAIDRKLHKH